MKQWPQDDPDALERLSAMVDGEAEGATVERLCAAWREQPAARAWWHTYHLSGDVLRSEDLSSDAKRDAAFLRAVRERLAKEPVVLAPTSEANTHGTSAPRAVPPRNERPSRWRAWSASIAVAAGFVAVVGALLVTQAPAPIPPPALAGASDASALPNAGAVAPVLAGSVDAEPQSVVGSGKVIRDARLEHYLAAHKQFAGSSALGVPSGFLRAATAEVPSR
jgi:sigma-E factor negative regulatory protein RseA